MLEVRCPNCGEDDRSRMSAERIDGVPHITCNSCGRQWTRDFYDCPSCGEKSLTPVRKPLYQKARGTQQSIIGFRIAKQCSSCGWVSEA